MISCSGLSYSESKELLIKDTLLGSDNLIRRMLKVVHDVHFLQNLKNSTNFFFLNIIFLFIVIFVIFISCNFSFHHYFFSVYF